MTDVFDGWDMAAVNFHWSRKLSDGRSAHISSWSTPHSPSDPDYRSGYSLIIDHELIGNDFNTFTEARQAAEQ